jgi:hypothetical protein
MNKTFILVKFDTEGICRTIINDQLIIKELDGFTKIHLEDLNFIPKVGEFKRIGKSFIKLNNDELLPNDSSFIER